MSSPLLTWETGTAFDLFVSLEVLHHPARAGLRRSWAAGVRSRLCEEHRDCLEQAVLCSLLPFPWLIGLPEPKDGASLLRALGELPAEDRLAKLNAGIRTAPELDILEKARKQGAWSEADRETLQRANESRLREQLKKSKKPSIEALEAELNAWAHAKQFGERLLSALNAYYDVFFAEEEQRIRPALEKSAKRSKSLAKVSTMAELLEELSQGVRFDIANLGDMDELILIPSFWSTPLILFIPITGSDRWMFMFGGRPSDVSLVPGEVVPELLVHTLKALADPTRLRIVRYLSAEPLSPAELSRRLRLRLPTVLHHLNVLRLARLVQVTVSQDGRRYESRPEAIRSVADRLMTFLEGE